MQINVFLKNLQVFLKPTSLHITKFILGNQCNTGEAIKLNISEESKLNIKNVGFHENIFLYMFSDVYFDY